MDHLKAVGKAIKNSPRALRKKLHLDHHQHLEEDWYHSEDPVNAGVTFYVKYLGSTSVTRTHGTGSTDDAVKTIVQDAKTRGGKLQKVMITVSSRYVRLVDMQLQMKLDELPLYRVSYCTVDPYYDKVFCYISRNAETKGLECHAFLCSKKSKAEAITLTVAQAFNIAFERWQATKRQKTAQKAQTDAAKGAGATATSAHTKTSNGAAATAVAGASSGAVARTTPTKQVAPPTTNDTLPVLAPPPTKRTSPTPPSPSHKATKDPQLDIGVTPSSPTAANPSLVRTGSRDDTTVQPGLLEVKTTIQKAVSLDYLQLEDNYDMEFTRLAQARSNPRLPIGDHIDHTNVGEDVMGYLQGEKTSRDMAATRSVDDLLDL